MKRRMWLMAGTLAMMATPAFAIENTTSSSSHVDTTEVATTSTSMTSDKQTLTDHTVSHSHEKGLLTEDITGQIHFAAETPQPPNITVMLKTNKTTRYASTSSRKGWKYTFKSIPKSEVATAKVTLPTSLNNKYIITQDGNNFTLAAIPKETLTYKVIFDNQGTMVYPKNPKLTLTQNGVPVKAFPKVSINNNTYTYTFNVKKAEGYDAVPSVVNDKQYTQTRQGNTFTYTAKTTTIKGNVVFKTNKPDKTPANVIVNIMNGQEIKTVIDAKKSNQYQFTSKKLASIDAKGNPIHYTIKGLPLIGYNGPEVKGNTLTYTSVMWKVPIEKYDKNHPDTLLNDGIINIQNATTSKLVIPINNELPAGQTYEVTTVMAPLGYKKPNQKVMFRILNDGTLQQKEGDEWKTVKAVRLPYEKVKSIIFDKGSQTTPSGGSQGGLNFGKGQGITLPNLSNLVSKIGSNLHLPSFDFSNLFNKLGSGLDLGNGGLNLGKGLDLPSLSGSTSHLPSLSGKSNGGLGNFEDLFKKTSDSSSSSILPKTGDKKQYALVIVGAIIIVAVLAFIVFRVKQRKRS